MGLTEKLLIREKTGVFPSWVLLYSLLALLRIAIISSQNDDCRRLLFTNVCELTYATLVPASRRVLRISVYRIFAVMAGGTPKVILERSLYYTTRLPFIGVGGVFIRDLLLSLSLISLNDWFESRLFSLFHIGDVFHWSFQKLIKDFSLFRRRVSFWTRV